LSHRQKERHVSQRGIKPRGSNGPSGKDFYLARNNKQRYDQPKENNAQDNGDPKQRALHPAAGSEDTAGISPGQSTQACAFALDNNTEN
jgi:hypothetical protein